MIKTKSTVVQNINIKDEAIEIEQQHNVCDPGRYREILMRASAFLK